MHTFTRGRLKRERVYYKPDTFSNLGIIFFFTGDKTYSLDKTNINYVRIFRVFNIIDNNFNYLTT